MDNIEDEWMQVAALSATSARASRFFEKAVSRKAGLTATETKGRSTFFRQVCSVIGARRDASEIQAVLQKVVRGQPGGAGPRYERKTSEFRRSEKRPGFVAEALRGSSGLGKARIAPIVKGGGASGWALGG